MKDIQSRTQNKNQIVEFGIENYELLFLCDLMNESLPERCFKKINEHNGACCRML